VLCYQQGEANADEFIKQKMEPVVKYLGNKLYLAGTQISYVDFIFLE